jgi:hypothetical protein
VVPWLRDDITSDAILWLLHKRLDGVWKRGMCQDLLEGLLDLFGGTATSVDGLAP